MDLLRGWEGLERVTSRSPAAVTIGSFDGPHLGHRAIIDTVVAAAARRDLLPTLVTFEPHPRAFLAPARAPLRLSRWSDRLPALERLHIGRVVVLRFDAALAQMSPGAFVQRLLVDGLATRHVVVGADFRFGHRASGDVRQLTRLGEQAGFAVEVMDDRRLAGARVSSSAVRDVLGAGDLETAARLLGHPYRITGRVARGQQLGRTLGYPTANLALAGWQPPVSGVFAVRVRAAVARGLPGCAHRAGAMATPHSAKPRAQQAVTALPPGQSIGGMANVGMRPTVGGLKRLLEVHLFDFEGDLYGQRLAVDFVARLRAEQRFDGLDALRAQLARDAQAARAALADGDDAGEGL